MVTAQKLFATNGNVPIVIPPYAEEFVKQSNEITRNVIRAVDINNQLTISALHAVGENYRTFNGTVDSVTEFTTTAAKSWNSFLTAQQQQFVHKQ
ncbi:MAG: hypothetical protein WAZ77_14475 [Candidatus Nitrosopolaris sp.]|jgi:hypothetical protein